MGNAVRLPLALLLLGALAACSSNRAKAPDAAETMTPPAATSEPGVVATPLDADGVVGAGMAAEPNEGVVNLPPELVDRRVIYFSYDSDTLGPTEIELVALVSTTSVSVSVERRPCAVRSVSMASPMHG